MGMGRFPSPNGAWIVTPPLLYPETMRVVKAQSANLIKITPVLPSFWQKYRSIPGTLRGANFPENGCVLGVRTKAVLCPGNRFSGQHFEADAFSKLFCRCFSQPLCRMIYGGLLCSKPAFHCGSFLQRAFQFVHSPDKKWAFFPSWGTNFPVYIKYFICS